MNIDGESSYPRLPSGKIDVEEWLRRQGVEPIRDPTVLIGDFWPEDESIDDFVAAVREWRRESTSNLPKQFSSDTHQSSAGTLFAKVSTMNESKLPTQYSDLLAALDKFNLDFPRPNLKPLDASEKYVLQEHWPRKWPGSDLPGVYVFLTADDSIVYIGKASCNRCIGTRLGDYFSFREPSKKLGLSVIHAKANDVAAVIIIAIPDKDRAFEAPALEEYLIRSLNPVRNRNAKDDSDLESSEC